MIEIIVIDDDPTILKLFELHFKSEINTKFTLIDNYLEGLAEIANKSFDLYIVDYKLGAGDGIKLISILQKEKNIDNRVLLMSSELPAKKRIDAFNLGVSNIINKPIDYEILRAIINKNIRMVLGQYREVIRIDNVELNINSYQCFLYENDDRKEIHLTPTEFKILHKLLINNSRVISKDELSYMGKDPNSPMSYKSLEMKIVTLRKKLGTSGEKLKTARGIGYRF